MVENSPARNSDDGILDRRRAQVLDKLIGGAPAFVQVREQLSRLSESEATVLIAGETGTGKELTARALH
jgi:transcriptional regulator with AAA-type ATPase domain